MTSRSIKVSEQCRVSPPPGFIFPQTSLPLTFFDLMCLPMAPFQMLFFYSNQNTDSNFMQTTLPNIKHSLTLTLQHFYPLLGTLTWHPEYNKPEISFDENSCVVLTVAESNLDFNKFLGNHPRDVNDFFPLVPQLSPVPTRTEAANTQQVEHVPVMALQVTLFPNSGICIGIIMSHVIADGKSATHFIKSWASVCKSGIGDTCLSTYSLPFYDRTVVKDPNDLDTIYLNEMVTLGVTQQSFHQQNIPQLANDKVRATFVLSRFEIEKLKTFILNQFDKMYKAQPLPLRLTSFVVWYTYVWVCLVKVLACDQDVDSMEIEQNGIPMDCRERLSPPLPSTYFGNCVMGCMVTMKRNDLMGENGIALAAEAIAKSIKKKIDEGVLARAETYLTEFKSLMCKQWFLTISGSPKFGVYDTDFGWGKPNKFDIMSIDCTKGAISVSESADNDGGIEFGLVLNKRQMDAFASLFAKDLSVLA